MSDDGRPSGGRGGRLSAFQKAMLQWNSLHPYNAVHAARVAGTPDPERLTGAIAATLSAHGLTGLTLNARRGTYRYLGGPAVCDLAELTCGGDAAGAIAVELERQLNTPFVLARPGTPFRFFVAHTEGSFWLGLAYLHAVADAVAIVLLLKEIIQRYLGASAPSDRGIGRRAPPPPRHPLLSQPVAFARKVAALPVLIRELRGSCRPHYSNARDLRNGVALFSLEPRTLRRLVVAAKSWGVTVNDVVLALLLQSCALLAACRRQTVRRNKISLGCIVNIRKDLGAEYEDAFGLFLGSFVVTHAVPQGLPLEALARDMARKTREVKRKKLYLAAPLELSFGRFLLSLFPAERRLKLYPKHYPLWGGVTNMNINSLWKPRAGEPPVDYLRAVSTGPATPLVLSFTTAGEVANISVSYRSTVFSAADIERVRAGFLGALAGLEEGQ